MTLQDKPKLVLIHGWAGICALLQPLADCLLDDFDVHLLELPGFDQGKWPSAEDDHVLIDSLLPQLPEQAVYLGWSMGGNIASLIAKYYPERVQALILLTSNPCFVAKDAWPGMAQEQFDHFQMVLEQDVLKTLLEFQFLVVSGHEQKRPLLRQIANLSKQAKLSKDNLAASLAWLGKSDCREALSHFKGPKLAVLAQNDALVPKELAVNFSGLGIDVECIANTGHAPLLSEPEALAKLVRAYIVKIMRQRHNKAVAASFAKAATSYDSAADLQRQICDHLLAILPPVRRKCVLELGCGTGYAVKSLSALQADMFIASDLSFGMLEHVKHKHGLEQGLMAVDAQQIPLADGSVDCVFSSLAVQWCRDYPALFSEIYRVLEPGGEAYIATLGPKTLYELKQAWATVDNKVHVNDFVDINILQQSAQEAGLRFKHDVQSMQPKYQKLAQLMHELKAIGAHNLSEQRPKGLTGKKKLQALIRAYEVFRDTDGLLPATYEVFYLSLSKPLTH